MYAVIQSGGKQFRVSEGSQLRVEKLRATVGETITLDHVLLVANGDQVTTGTPLVPGCQVQAEVLRHDRAKKVKIIKFRRRKHHMKRQGHRQYFTELRITGIQAA